MPRTIQAEGERIKVIKVTNEVGRCCVCSQRLKSWELYYDLGGMWVHKDCFEKWEPCNRALYKLETETQKT